MLPDGLMLSAFLPREDARDAFIGAAARRARGPAAGRDRRHLVAAAPGADAAAAARLEVVLFRGNVETRLRKLASGAADATLLALAGLNRLGLARQRHAILDPESFRRPPAQGAIGIETRDGDVRAARCSAPIDHATRPGARRRARLPRRARRLLPHADRRRRQGRRQRSAFSRAGDCGRTVRRPKRSAATDRRPQPPRSAGRQG